MNKEDKIAEACDKFTEFLEYNGAEEPIVFYTYVMGDERNYGCTSGDMLQQIGALRMMEKHLTNEA
jgi:hypothetical protein